MLRRFFASIYVIRCISWLIICIHLLIFLSARLLFLGSETRHALWIIDLRAICFHNTICFYKATSFVQLTAAINLITLLIFYEPCISLGASNQRHSMCWNLLCGLRPYFLVKLLLQLILLLLPISVLNFSFLYLRKHLLFWIHFHS